MKNVPKRLRGRDRIPPDVQKEIVDIFRGRGFSRKAAFQFMDEAGVKILIFKICRKEPLPSGEVKKIDKLLTALREVYHSEELKRHIGCPDEFALFALATYDARTRLQEDGVRERGRPKTRKPRLNVVLYCCRAWVDATGVTPTCKPSVITPGFYEAFSAVWGALHMEELTADALTNDIKYSLKNL